MKHQITDFDLIMNEYHDLYDDFDKNYGDDPMIKKLNKLERWKKNIFVMYITCGYKLKPTAQMLSCSMNTVRKAINEIKEELQK